MKGKIIFKAVRKKGKCLTSLIRRKHSLTYKPDEWVKPHIGKIFAFVSQKDAVSFIKRQVFGNQSIQVWKAMGKNPSGITQICTVNNVEEFWLGKLSKYYKIPPPEGTIVVDEIKILKRVV